EYTTNQTYEPISQIAHIRIYYERLDSPDGDRHLRVVRLAHRQFFPAELATLLWEHGLAIETRWGGFSGEPFEGDSESQGLLCTRRLAFLSPTENFSCRKAQINPSDGMSDPSARVSRSPVEPFETFCKMN